MKIIHYIIVLVASIFLCGCPSPGLVIFRNDTAGVIHLRPENFKPITIPAGTEIALKIQIANDAVLYSNHFHLQLSDAIWEGYVSNEFRFFSDDKYGNSTRVCLISKDNLLYLARKINKTDQIVLPKKQPKGFPLKLR